MEVSANTTSKKITLTQREKCIFNVVTVWRAYGGRMDKIIVPEAPEVVVETPTPSGEAVLVPKHTERPPSLENEPYLIKELDLSFSKDHFQMPELIKEANEFILGEMKRKEMDDSQESYKTLIKKYSKGIPDGTDQYALVEHIVDRIRIDKKLIDAMLEKEELDKKPIDELTSKQLKDRIENGQT